MVLSDVCLRRTGAILAMIMMLYVTIWSHVTARISICACFPSFSFANVYTTIGGLSSKFEEFLAVRSQFDSDHGVDFSAPTCCQSATFVRPLFAFYCPLFFMKIIINNAALHFMPHMNAVFVLDVATPLLRIKR